MNKLFDKLQEDVRFREGLKACINCGTCTAICPAAEFYDYDPRQIVDIVQTRDEEKIEALLKSETIWYCGECMSCKTRCPRGNVPGLIICALRSLSQELGYFVESEKGRQQLALKRTIGKSILKTGYCVSPELVAAKLHPEQGPMWEWSQQHLLEIYNRLGANYKGDGPGALRKIPEEALDELARIFEITGGNKRFETIEEFSSKKAKELGLELDSGTDSEYFLNIYTTNNNRHNKK